jgi:hypothetical protein
MVIEIMDGDLAVDAIAELAKSNVRIKRFTLNSVRWNDGCLYLYAGKTEGDIGEAILDIAEVYEKLNVHSPKIVLNPTGTDRYGASVEEQVMDELGLSAKAMARGGMSDDNIAKCVGARWHLWSERSNSSQKYIDAVIMHKKDLTWN